MRTDIEVAVKLALAEGVARATDIAAQVASKVALEDKVSYASAPSCIRDQHQGCHRAEELEGQQRSQ